MEWFPRIILAKEIPQNIPPFGTMGNHLELSLGTKVIEGRIFGETGI